VQHKLGNPVLLLHPFVAATVTIASAAIKPETSRFCILISPNAEHSRKPFARKRRLEMRITSKKKERAPEGTRSRFRSDSGQRR
jgi:hypothetical protein